MFLDEILTHKRGEVEAAKREVHPGLMQDLLLNAPPARGFAEALRRDDGRMALIAEIKKASPSAGVIQPNFDPLRQGKEYEAAGADCLSILTDEKYFQGHLCYLRDVRCVVGLPVLRKDFTVDAFQIAEARAAGADAILLIVAALTSPEIKDFSALAAELGMDALVEVHTEAEMETALELDAKLIGINSRDLKTFKVELGVIERVAKLAPPDVTLIGESGIKTRQDVDRLRAAGISAILVGETLMRAASVESAARELVG